MIFVFAMERFVTNVFDSEGRISQIEYAIKNVNNAGTSIGMKCTDGILLIGLKNKLQDNFVNRTEKIYKLNDDKYAVISGLFGDALQIITVIRKLIQDHYYEHGEEILLHTLASEVGLKLQYFTQNKNTRPFGASFILISRKENELMSCDPTGATNRWNSKAFGLREDSLNNEFSALTRTFTMEEGVYECFRLIAKKQEMTPKNAPFYEVFLFDQDIKRKPLMVPAQHIERVITQVKENQEIESE